jgi:hypothetical protein
MGMMRDMAIGKAQRWEEHKPKFVVAFGTNNTMLRQAEKLFALLQLAWHDCYGRGHATGRVIDDILLCSQGTLGGLIEAAQLAVIDSRDLHLLASGLRTGRGSPQ